MIIRRGQIAPNVEVLTDHDYIIFHIKSEVDGKPIVTDLCLTPMLLLESLRLVMKEEEIARLLCTYSHGALRIQKSELSSDGLRWKEL